MNAQGFLKHPKLDNERMIKIGYLSSGHASEYDSYTLGSSRIGMIDPAWLKKYIPKAVFYNLSVPGSTPYDQLAHIKYFLKEGFPVRHLIIQHDIEPAFEPPSGAIYMRLHPLVTGEPVWLLRLKYLVVFSKEAIVSKWEYNQLDHNVIFNINTGHLNAFTDNANSFLVKSQREKQFPLWVLKKRLDGMQNLYDICQENNIDVRVIVSPHNQHYMDKINTDGYLYELERLTRIFGGVWDFSGYNSVTTNDENYHEISHHRTYVARWLVAKIFYDNSVQNIPEDFGQLITLKNMQNYIAHRRLEVERRDIALHTRNGNSW